MNQEAIQALQAELDRRIAEQPENYPSDVEREFRGAGTPTDLRAPGSRHYECDMHVVQCGDKWVAFPYWYGGGKHGDPEAIPWLDAEEVRFVNMREETRVVQVFTEIPTTPEN